MVARSQATNSDISILIDPETILLPDIFTTLTYIHKLNLDWFLFSTSRNISYFPYQLVDNGIWVQEDGKKIESKKLQEILDHKWTKSACGQRLLMAWNSGESPLHAGILPPFLYGNVFMIFGSLMRLDLEMPVTLKLPFSLESLLEIVADRDKNVVLGIAGASYRDMLMSWACRLRHLGVSNILACALDSETYEFSVLQGLPVFMDSMSPRNVSFDDCHFGTECFQRVTKVKSRIVLQILKLGYNVLLSDVDVYWFNNPLPYLLSFGPDTLVAQSDEYNETGPINIPRRLNSGFYFVRSGLATIAAMEMVVKHASTSNLSEQPSFYDVLCGEGGVNRVGNDQCYEPKTSLTVFFLDRNFFPNGAYMGFWRSRMCDLLV
uniref:Nucleotide-diphospho-sugar transferase domain-containing protein n=1 Tax=Ananas comosus var. bracteatus TaxID=296719 RepID=A0A6V7PU82_ANACO|nr:unnamed protein product [Ananas comosus var. bracteatus]